MEFSLSRDMLDAFESRFGHRPAVCGVAPGRLNLIGEHTDYNDGLVLPVAIDLRTTAYLSWRDDHLFVCHSMANGETVEVSMDDLEEFRNRGWFSYVAGVASLLVNEGIPLRGINCLLVSTIPIGAGLSSSAALEVAVTFGLLALAERSLPAERTIQLCQKAEWDYAGVSCGIMDQFISVRGSSETALLIDCGSLLYDAIPVDRSLIFVVCDTNVPHSLSDSGYNARRDECARAVRTLQSAHYKISSLRDVSMKILHESRNRVDHTSWKRAHHVVSENERVIAASDALWYKDHSRLGTLMNESHESLKTDYEVSCDELDIMARICRSVDGVHGARMVGAGFGGSVLAIANTDIMDTLKSRVHSAYTAETKLEASILTCRVGEGARAIHIC